MSPGAAERQAVGPPLEPAFQPDLETAWAPDGAVPGSIARGRAWNSTVRHCGAGRTGSGSLRSDPRKPVTVRTSVFCDLHNMQCLTCIGRC